MTKLTGAALDRAVANAMGVKNVHNCERWGEHMNRIEEDDDIQDYKKPWKKLTEEERASFWTADQMTQKEWDELFDAIEAKLREKNA
jgi:hypothetical protein